MANRRMKYWIVFALAGIGSLGSSGGVGGQEHSEGVDEFPGHRERASLWTRQAGEDWPSFLGPTGDGKSSERGILTDWSHGNLKVVWKMETGKGYGMGAVAEGRFYHFGRWGEQTELRCLNAETGEAIWEFSYDSQYRDLYGYGNGPRTSPVINDGRVYIYGVEGKLHCLDAVKGELIWKLDTQKRFGVVQNFFGVASTPIVVDDLLLVMVGGSPEASSHVPPGALDQVKPDGTGLIAVNKVTGELKYQVVDDLASYVSLKRATLQGRSVVLAWMRGRCMEFGPRRGRLSLSFLGGRRNWKA